MKTLNGILIGLVLGAAAGGWLGINYAREVPLTSNPFVKPTLSDRAKWSAQELLDDAKRAIDE
ncbi:MAG: hypothetical protein BMS9Abin26_0628 [Gammaproteobacteria bacterium]|nr:MAG: hypothetical protein BMS9Abin26_0628 [Gammaproteobacteria bacterium]